MIIFDDIFDGDVVGKNLKAQRALIRTFIRDITENGRHYNINMCITSHLFLAGHESKSILNDATGFVVMLNNMNIHGILGMFESYIGIKEKQALELITEAEGSRWLYYNRKDSNFIMTQQYIKLYNPVVEYVKRTRK
jgi:hypothetical protein